MLVFHRRYIRANRAELKDTSLTKSVKSTPSATALGLGFFYRVYKEKKMHWEVGTIAANRFTDKMMLTLSMVGVPLFYMVN